MDEFQNFKKQIITLKNKNSAILQEAVTQIPQSKKDFLKNVLAVERVSNEPRQIFTIKRNKWAHSLRDIKMLYWIWTII